MSFILKMRRYEVTKIRRYNKPRRGMIRRYFFLKMQRYEDTKIRRYDRETGMYFFLKLLTFPKKLGPAAALDF